MKGRGMRRGGARDEGEGHDMKGEGHDMKGRGKR